IPPESGFQLPSDRGIPCATEFDEPSRAQEMRCVVVGVLSSYQQHAAPLIVGRHWEEQSTTWAESVEPGWERMRGPCTGDDRVCWIERSLGPISVQDRDLMPMLESLASLFRKCCVDFDGSYLACGTVAKASMTARDVTLAEKRSSSA